MNMRQWTPVLIAVVVILAGCGGAPPKLDLRYPGGETDAAFDLVNASDGTWSEVRVEVRAMRPDGVEAPCADERFPTWPAGAARALRKCPGEKLLVTLSVGGEQAHYVFAEGTLYRKLGRREIPVR
jgi:hypothetical protein